MNMATVNSIAVIKLPTIDRQHAITISFGLDEKYTPKTSSETVGLLSLMMPNVRQKSIIFIDEKLSIC